MLQLDGASKANLLLVRIAAFVGKRDVTPR